MNNQERFVRTLTGRPVDRVPFMKVFGGTNQIVPEWENQCPGLSQNIDQILQFEGDQRGWAQPMVNYWLSQRGTPEILERTQSSRLLKYSDGTVEIERDGDYYHQTVKWPVKGRNDWRRIKAKHLDPHDPERFPDDWPLQVKKYATRDYPLRLHHGGVYGFARLLMGDEQLMYTFHDDPKLIHAMMDTYTDMIIELWRKMIKDVQFDLIECWEDMASKNGQLISPDMFREFLSPQFHKISAFAKDHGIEIILVDSDGYVDDLVDLMAEAGVTAMYPFEVNAGCDIRKIRDKHPNMAMIGGLNKQVMALGKKEIDKEIEKSREYIQMGRYIPGPDHFVLSDVSWPNYKYFMQQLRQVVMTTTPQN